jgi:hypothetical protein
MHFGKTQKHIEKCDTFIGGKMKTRIWSEYSKTYLPRDEYVLTQDGQVLDLKTKVLNFLGFRILDDKDVKIERVTDEKDRNKVDLWEGDIVICGDLKGIIRYRNYPYSVGFYIQHIGEDGFYDPDSMRIQFNEVLKVGNINENPELIEKQIDDTIFLEAIEILEKQFPDRNVIRFKIKNGWIYMYICCENIDDMRRLDNEVDDFWYHGENDEDALREKYNIMIYGNWVSKFED